MRPKGELFGKRLDLEVTPGRCAFCDCLLKNSRQKITCRSKECMSAYQKVYSVWKRTKKH